MYKTLKIINEMVKAGVISDYAIGGSVGAMFYTESVNTKDLDIFVYAQILPSGLIRLDHIYNYLESIGHLKWAGQFIIIEGVPVDFLVADELTGEALKDSVKRKYNNIMVRVMKPEYLIAIALKARRDKDFGRARMLLTQATINEKLLRGILKRHHIKW